MKNIYMICLAFIALTTMLSFAAEAIPGFSVNNTITLDGDKNPVKKLFKNGYVNELESFTTDNTDFNWFDFVNKNYTVILDNISINSYKSIRSLLWFINNGFKVIINYSSFIGPVALEDFIELAPVRSDSDFTDLILYHFPSESGFSGMGRTGKLYDMVINKGYTSIRSPF